jgi:hypothetical protein
VLAPKANHVILVRVTVIEILIARQASNVDKETTLSNYLDLLDSRNSKAKKEAKMVQTNMEMATTAITQTSTRKLPNVIQTGLTQLLLK